MMLFTQIGVHGKVLAVIIIALWGAIHMAAFVITQVRIIQAANKDKAFALSLNMASCNLGISIGAATVGWVSSQFTVNIIGYVAVCLALLTALIAFLIKKIVVKQRPYLSRVE